MEPRADHYPIFEANQVLTNTHLNDVFDYLDEQQRLTRTNLIGIGIVCGLEIKLVGTTIHLSKGCGITSEGYLIVEQTDVSLVSYRTYNLPDDVAYLPFKDKKINPSKQYELWELFPTGEPNTTPLSNDFLKDKAVLLFLELKKEDLRNCSPNNCDDKGAKVTATVRRLLIKTDDLKTIIAEANKLGTGLTAADLETSLLQRLNLPDLRLPRYDVPATNPATSQQILAAFLTLFKNEKLADKTGVALTAAYEAFKPLVQSVYPDNNNPFKDFTAKFSFLDSAPTTTIQVRFLQYYYDFFDDLLKAYDEFRWLGVELLCACCPSEGLFPRHLMLGELFPTGNATLYRQGFLAAPAISNCEQKTRELQLLFQRLVEMTKRFTNDPPLPKVKASNTDAQIRITPSKLGDVPLSEKCIPYYYTQNGDPTQLGVPMLYQLWNPEKTRRGRAAQNLSYRADEYANDDFVKTPLRYDLEPHNFLRIEGHLGKHYQSVLQTLLALKSQYRLPIEIVALRTGAFDETMTVDLSKEECRFQDLEALYDVEREQWLCLLVHELTYLYDLSYKFSSPITNAVKSQFDLINKYEPDFLVKPNTLGRFFEDYVTSQSGVVPDLNVNLLLNIINTITISDDNIVYLSFFYFIQQGGTLPVSLTDFDYAGFETRYKNLEIIVQAIEQRREQGTNQLEGTANILHWEEIDDRLEDILNACRQDVFKAIADEYKRRIREVKQKQFLSFFLQKNPGIQHKAGVLLGGTFILVYHDDPDPVKTRTDFVANVGLANTSFTRTGLSAATAKILSGAFNRLQTKANFVADPDLQIIFGELTGQIPTAAFFPGSGGLSAEAEKIFTETVNQFADGTVIADFFLPYLCCSDCAPVQFVLPPPPVTFTLEPGCTNANGQAEATITPQGGTAPYTYKLDNQPFQALSGKPVLAAGPHTIVIRDSAGVESAAQPITVPTTLMPGVETYTDDVPNQTYQVSFTIVGGTPPYTADSGTMVGTRWTSAPVKSDNPITVKITDSIRCKAAKEFNHKVAPPCDLPCKGIALRCGFRFWLPEPEPNHPYKSFGVEVPKFVFEFPQGALIDLTKEVQAIIRANPDDLTNKFGPVVQDWLTRINKLIATKAGSADWLKLEYVKLPTETFGTLWIEYFECLKFEFHIQSFFQRPNSSERLDMTYTPKGTAILDMLGVPPKIIPPFDCLRIDKCDAQRPTENRCKEVDLILKINKKITDGGISLDVTTNGNDRPVAWLWEVQDGIPALSTTQKAAFTFEKFDPPVKAIRLTAFTEKGCRVIMEDKTNIPGQ